MQFPLLMRKRICFLYPSLPTKHLLRNHPRPPQQSLSPKQNLPPRQRLPQNLLRRLRTRDTAFQSPLSYWNLTEDNLQENKIAEDGVFLQSVYVELDEPLRLVKNYLLDLCLSAPFQQSKMTEEDYIDQQGKYFVTNRYTYTGQEKLDSYTDWTEIPDRLWSMQTFIIPKTGY